MCNWSSKFVLKAVFHLSTVARIEDCYVTTNPLNACIYVSQCSKTLCLSFKQLYKKRHASETPNLLLFVVLNLPRGVNLHEIQYKHDIFFYNSISHLHNGRSINVMVLQVLLDCYEFSTFSVWPQRAYQLKWNLNQLVSIYCTFSFTYIICYGTQSIHHHITPQSVLNEVIYTAWSKNNLHTSKTSIVWSY